MNRFITRLAVVVVCLTVTVPWALGQALTVPYEKDIYTDKNADGLTFVNYQGGGQAWSYKSKSNYRAIAAGDGSQWVMLPLLHLEADVQYVLNLYGYSATYDPNFLEIAIGTSETPDEYTTFIADSLHYERPEGSTATYTDHLVPFFAPGNATGDYHIAFRVLDNEDNNNQTWIRKISVEAGSQAAAPDSVAVLSVTPAELGQLKATVSVTTPTLDLAGAQLTSLTELRVYRNDSVLVFTQENPEVGTAYTFEDNGPSNGFNTYTAICANEAGDGPDRKVKAYIGMDAPDWPENVQLLDMADGTFRLTWELPKGQNGGYVNPETVRYRVYYIENTGGSLLADNVDAYSYDYQNAYQGSQPGDLKIMQLAVQAFNEQGESYARAGDVMLGTPYELPFAESYTDQTISTNPWLSIAETGGSVQFALTEDSQDGDHGAFYLAYAQVGETAIFKSPLINIASAQHPVLSYYYYAKPGQGLSTDVILLKNQQERYTVAQIDHRSLSGDEGWRKMVIDLTDYVDSRYVSLSFNNHILDNTGVCRFDNLLIQDTPDSDLAVTLDAPYLAMPGDEITVTATVSNKGLQEVADPETYTLEVYAGDELIASEEETDLAANEDQAFAYTYTVPEGTKGVALRAQVTLGSDTNAENNVAEHSVGVDTEVLNAVNDLAGVTDEQVTLTWSNPANSARFVDSFEDYPAFACDTIGAYTCINYQPNADQRYIISNYFPNSNRNYAFYLFSAHEEGYDKYATVASLQAHTGNKMLYTTSLADEGLERNDAWIISPELSGKEQVMSFWAKTYNENFGQERVQLYYSTEGSDGTANGPARAPQKESFKLLLDANVPGAWTQYGAYLPEGTKHFAIRYCSYDKFIMFMDDFAYDYGEKAIDHYNIYRNGQLIDSTSEPTYVDQGANQGDEYTVTVVYADGEETSPSNVYVVTDSLTGVTTITPDSNTDSNAIYNLAGQCMRGDLNSLPRGIYIVAGKKVVK